MAYRVTFIPGDGVGPELSEATRRALEGTGFRSVNVALRKELDLYCCLRPCKWYPGVRSKYQDVDIVICRENTEDLYAGIEFEQGKPETLKLTDFMADLAGKPI